MGPMGQGVKRLNGVDYILMDTPSQSRIGNVKRLQPYPNPLMPGLETRVKCSVPGDPRPWSRDYTTACLRSSLAVAKCGGRGESYAAGNALQVATFWCSTVVLMGCFMSRDHQLHF